jgi:hypothetical protein
MATVVRGHRVAPRPFAPPLHPIEFSVHPFHTTPMGRVRALNPTIATNAFAPVPFTL